MAITPAQLQSAVTVSQDLAVAAQQLRDFVKAVNDMAQNNWTETETIGGQPVTWTVNASAQASLLATYSTLKTALQALYSQLP